MKLVYTSMILALVSTAALSDIVIAPDGKITCTGRCDGVIVQGPGGTYTVCQGATCVTISPGIAGGRKPEDVFSKEQPKRN